MCLVTASVGVPMESNFTPAGPVSLGKSLMWISFPGTTACGGEVLARGLDTALVGLLDQQMGGFDRLNHREQGFPRAQPPRRQCTYSSRSGPT